MAMPRVDTQVGKVKLTLNVAMIIAFVMLQVLNAAINGGNIEIGPGTLNDWCLVFFVQVAMLNGIIWVMNHQDAAVFSVWALILYACLLGPESIDPQDIGTKFAMLLIVIISLDHFKSL